MNLWELSKMELEEAYWYIYLMVDTMLNLSKARGESNKESLINLLQYKDTGDKFIESLIVVGFHNKK